VAIVGIILLECNSFCNTQIQECIGQNWVQILTVQPSEQMLYDRFLAQIYPEIPLLHLQDKMQTIMVLDLFVNCQTSNKWCVFLSYTMKLTLPIKFYSTMNSLAADVTS